MADKAGPVRVVGLDDLRRDLRRVSHELEERLDGDAFEEVEKKVAAEAQANAVKRTGGYARSIVPLPGRGVGSLLPQAGVLHFGGVIRPRGVDITFDRRPVISEAMEKLAPEALDRVGELVDEAARDAGWKR